VHEHLRTGRERGERRGGREGGRQAYVEEERGERERRA